MKNIKIEQIYEELESFAIDVNKNIDKSLLEGIKKYSELLVRTNLDEKRIIEVLNESGKMAINKSQNLSVIENDLITLMKGFGCNNAFKDCYKMASIILGIDVYLLRELKK